MHVFLKINWKVHINLYGAICFISGVLNVTLAVIWKTKYKHYPGMKSIITCHIQGYILYSLIAGYVLHDPPSRFSAFVTLKMCGCYESFYKITLSQPVATLQDLTWYISVRYSARTIVCVVYQGMQSGRLLFSYMFFLCDSWPGWAASWPYCLVHRSNNS